MTYYVMYDAFQSEIYDKFQSLIEECCDILRKICAESKLADYVAEIDAVAYEREIMREREREAIPVEQARALARYKAHCTRMTAHKARQQLRRRKYRGGANAGWY